MSKSGWYALVAVLIAGFVWTSVQIKRSELEGNSLFGPAKGTMTVPTETPQSGHKAPDFTLKSLQNSEVSLADFKGQVVLLDFFATWCPPCRAAIPMLGELEAKYGDKGLKVISIDQGESQSVAADFAREMRYKALMLLDEDGSVGERYQVRGLPTFVIINQKGKESARQVGFAPYAIDDLEGQICKLLGVKFTPRHGRSRNERH